MADRLHKYSVFISSGGTPDCRELQDVCVQSTWDVGHAARALLGPAARLSAREEIDQADIFVRICRTLDEDVHSECFWALDAGKPTLLFVLPPHPDLGQFSRIFGSAPYGSSLREVSKDPSLFAKDYLITLMHAIRCLDAASSIGFWAEQTLDQFLRNPFWRRFAERVNQWATLDWRFNTNAPLKKAAAEYFLDSYLDMLRRSSISRLFFESGSSIAFLSEAFASRLDQGIKWNDLLIETNNILSYMEFVLSRTAPATLYPSGTPERKYGGTFGELMTLPIPSEEDPATDEARADMTLVAHKARERMSELRAHFREQYSDFGIIFGATSAIDLARTGQRAGPHVGSYHNMLFKRALLESGAPIVIFLDEDKFRRPFDPRSCFRVCDADFGWDYACLNVPLALVCAFRSEEGAKQVIPQLEYYGLEHLECTHRSEAPWPVIASNNLFWQRRRIWIEEARLRESVEPSRARSSAGF
jgi:hypothetical protein